MRLARMRRSHQRSPGEGREANPREMHAANLQNLQITLNLPEANDQANQLLTLLNLIQMGKLHGRSAVDLAGALLSINGCSDRLSHF